MLKLPVYLDNHSTTPVDPRVLEAMLPYFNEKFGNAASRHHAFGWEAEAAVDQARGEIARLIHTSAREIVFTSGATESNNLALKGAAEGYKDRGDHIVTCATEHRAVLDSCKALERRGFKVTYLPVDRAGRLHLDRLEAALTDKTILISLMAANNEIGTLHSLKEIGRMAKKRNIVFHSDAAQAVGKVPLDVEELGIDMLSISAHKMYGPKGVGALYVRSKGPKVNLKPIIDGGGHERGLRSGTLNVPAIVGFGKACEIARAEMTQEADRLASLRERLKDGLLRRLDEVYVNGAPERLPGNMNLSFAYIEGESLMMALKDIALSTGSACTTASLEPSHVLRALGLHEDLIHASIRFGLGRFNTGEEIDYTIGRVAEEVTRLRKLSPLYAAARRAAGTSAETVS
ncbi:MAG TPA: IscS subfamily cysteine desulfurase [Candidatus Binatia bacterium]|nr:IscS subfamily cysteine desulfurase [Candidatus Binatia bacterium]